MRARREARRSLLRDTRGLSTAEYIILMALICVVGFIAWRLFGRSSHERTQGAHHVVSGLATTTSSEDGEGGAHQHSDAPPPTATTAPGAAPHGGQGDVQRGRRMSIAGSEETYGEDEEVRRSRTRSRNFRWVVIGVLTAGVVAVLLGKGKRG